MLTMVRGLGLWDVQLEIMGCTAETEFPKTHLGLYNNPV